MWKEAEEEMELSLLLLPWLLRAEGSWKPALRVAVAVAPEHTSEVRGAIAAGPDPICAPGSVLSLP